MKLTPDMITDDQIRELLGDCDDDDIAECCRVALGDRPAGESYRSTRVAIMQANSARTRCVEILNARKTCRACEGDQIIAADRSTPPQERVTRDSRRCTYCGGKGYTS